MKNRKLNKILSICFVLILAGAALVSGTFAMNAGGIEMLSNNDSGSNGSIELIQEQRTAAEEFENYTVSKQLVPVVGSISKDHNGYPLNSNFVDRFVTVENNSNEELYVRLLVAMPAAFDNTEVAGGQDPINIIFEGDVIGGTQFGPESDDFWSMPELVESNVMCGNTLSNIYSIEYNQPLAPGDKASEYAMYGVFINSAVSNNGEHYTFNGIEIDYDINQGLDLKLKAQGIGTAAVAAGIDPFTLMDDNPWATGNNTSTSNSGDIQ